MATYTENYNMILPSAEDPYDAEDYNENFNIIDAALLSAEDTLSSIEDTLTSLEGKIDALASASGGIIKSIQSLEISHDAREALDQRYPITTVDPARSIVFLTHQKQQTNGAVINWTLYADNLHVTATEGAYAFFNVKFQIVEFY